MRFCDIDRYQPGTRYKVLLSKNKDPIINHIILYDSNRRLFKGPPARSFKPRKLVGETNKPSSEGKEIPYKSRKTKRVSRVGTVQQ